MQGLTMQTRVPVPVHPTLLTKAGDNPANGMSSTPLKSTDLLKGHHSVTIEHQGLIYRLQLTKLGKLILTK